MRIKKTQLYEWLLIILIFFNEHCFYIFNNFEYWIELTLCFAFIFWLLPGRHKDTTSSNIIFGYLLLGIISFLYTIFTPLQSVSKAIVGYIYFLIPIVGIAIAQNDKFSKTIIKDSMKKVSLYVSIVYLIQCLIGSRVQIIKYAIYTANGSVRIIVGSIIIAIGFLILYAEYLLDIKNIYNLAKISIVGGVILFIVRSRSLIFGVLIAMLYLTIHSLRSKMAKDSIILWRVIEAVFIIAIGVTGFRLISDIVSTSYALNESSSVLRLGAYQYYYNLFLEHPIIGIGKIRNQAVDGLAQWGIRHRYYIDDIGIVGYLAQFGILGMMFFVGWLVKCIRLLKYDDNGIQEKAILIFVIVMMPFNMILNIDTLVLYMILIPVLYGKSGD